MSKKIRITEEQFSQYIKEMTNWRGYDNFEEYQKEDDMELYEFLKVNTKRSGVSVDLWVDDGGSYVRHEHPLWLYVRNGYSYDDNFIPISICGNPQIMANNIKLKISYSILLQIKQFIRLNKKLIIALATKKINNIYFLDNVKSIKRTANEELINEMATLDPSLTGLPTEIWVDEGTSPQHAPRIKFKASSDQHITKEYTSMSIEDEPKVFNYPKKNVIVKPKDIQMIEQFVLYNKEILRMLGKGLIDYRTEFLPYMIRFGKNGGPIFPSALLDMPIQPNDKSNKSKKKKLN